VFTITKPSMTPLSRAHAPRRALSVIAVGGFCAMLAACSSSNASSAASTASSAASSAAAAANSAASSAASAASSAASAIASAASSAAGAASGASAADCVIIKQVDSNAISTLAPLETDSTAQATAALKTYITQLQADQAKLTSAGGKSALSAYIAALQKASTESTADATTTITSALGSLGAACP
jgi:trimeric autotransporter adhesin